MVGLRKLMAGWTKTPGAASPWVKRFRLGSTIIADPVRHIIIRDGNAVAVEPRVMQLLTFLAERPGQIISKEMLREQVWRTHVVDEAMHRAISLLRSALRDPPRHSTIIETVPRHGYRLLIAPAAIDTKSTWHPKRRALAFAGAAVGVAALALFVAPVWRSLPAEAPALQALAPQTATIASPRGPQVFRAERPRTARAVAAAPTVHRGPSRAQPNTPAAAPEPPAVKSATRSPPALAPMVPAPRTGEPSEAPDPPLEALVAE